MREQIIEYLVKNKEHFKESHQWLVDEKMKLFGIHSPLFHDDIEKEHNEMLNSLIITEVSASLGADYESICVVLEDLNLKEFLQ